MNRLLNSFYLIVAFGFLQASCEDHTTSPYDCTENPVTFSTDIQPIINSSCATTECHDKNSENGDYTTYSGLETIIKDGRFENRVLVSKTMPVDNPLPDSTLAQIQCWVDNNTPNN